MTCGDVENVNVGARERHVLEEALQEGLRGYNVDAKVVANREKNFIASDLLLIFDLLPRLNKCLGHHNIDRNL